ncbi:hypothetical protein HYT58_01040 [Candidatus Woesearchaeota archaeon]|nr:hypothetical protein [Candidatus Woesearchaeota archaeon]
MSKLSENTRKKIKEQIISNVFEHSPKALFTSELASMLARDEEFIKRLLIELKEQGILEPVSKNPKGKQLLSRRRWRLTEAALKAVEKQ